MIPFDHGEKKAIIAVLLIGVIGVVKDVQVYIFAALRAIFQQESSR